MSYIKNIIFDFDGTLADTSHLIVTTMQKSIEDCGLPHKTESEIRATIGLRLEEIPYKLWPGFKESGNKFADVYRKNFEVLKDVIPIRLYDGVKETLKVLKDKGINMSIATSRSHKSVEELTDKLGIRDNFDFLLGGNDVSKGKPDPESIYKIFSATGWEDKDTIMVGDMGVDILMGGNAHLQTCGVTYGNGNLSDLQEAGANFIIREFYDLKNIIFHNP